MIYIDPNSIYFESEIIQKIEMSKDKIKFSDSQKKCFERTTVMLQKRLTKLSQIGNELEFLFNYDLNHEEIRTFMNDEDSNTASLRLAERILTLGDFVNIDDVWDAVLSLKKDGYEGEKLFHPLRALISGTLSGPNVEDIAETIINRKHIKELMGIRSRCRQFIETFKRKYCLN